MSEKEKELCAKVAKLPQELLDKFVDKIDGAAMAIEVLAAADKAEQGKEAGKNE